MRNQVLGVIGLGRMGSAIASRLLELGCQVKGFDVGRKTSIVPPGLVGYRSLGEFLGSTDVAILSLPSVEAVHAIVAEVEGVGRRTCNIFVDTSTIGVSTAVRVAEELNRHDIVYLDAPVSGGPERARAGELCTMVAGPEDGFIAVRPILETIATRVFHVGQRNGMGQAIKLINNYLAYANMLVASEALAAGVQAGFDLESMIDIINCSSGRSLVTEEKFPKQIISRLYRQGAPASVIEKDLALYRESFDDLMPSCSIVQSVISVWTEFSDAYGSFADMAEIFKYHVERHS